MGQTKSKNYAPKYIIDGNLVNGVDTSLFDQESYFIGNDETLEAGIYDMYWLDGHLHITLGQKAKTTDFSWGARESGWIDLSEYSPVARYIAATDEVALEMIANGQAEYWRDPEDENWTVRLVEQEGAA